MQTAPKRDIFTIPNMISFARLLSVPVLVWLMAQDKNIAALLLFLVIGASDWLDGTIARATNSVSEFGILLDPVSDRVCVAAIGIALLATHRVAWWVVAPIVIREAGLSVAFLLLQRRGYGRPRVKRVGKVSLFVLFVGAALLLIDGATGRLLGSAVLLIGTALSYFAAVKYGQEVAQMRSTGTLS